MERHLMFSAKDSYSERDNVICSKKGSIKNAVLLTVAFLLTLMFLKIRRVSNHQNGVQNLLKNEVKQSS